MNKWLNILGWVIMLGSLFALLAFTNGIANTEMLSSERIKVEIHRQMANEFLLKEDLLEIALHGTEHSASASVHQYNCAKLESLLKHHPYIENAEVYISIDGMLHVEAWERTPIARIFSEDQTYYMDHLGYLMPVSSRFAAHSVVFSGEVNEPYNLRYKKSYDATFLPDSIKQKTLLDDIFVLSSFFDQNPFWNAQIEQVHVNKDSEFELIPRVGNHRIVLGAVDRLEEKFTKLKVFYKEGLSKTGWNEYKLVNLKYKNQVVCIKR